MRTDEMFRMDILEIILRAKKYTPLSVKCMEMAAWEDEEWVLGRDDY